MELHFFHRRHGVCLLRPGASEDMRRLLQATDGKVFTLATMPLLIKHTRIREYKVR